MPTDSQPSHEAAFTAWRDSLQKLTATEDSAKLWRRSRYRFAHQLGAALVDATGGQPALRGPVLYGVWLRWGLLYVGQTMEAERRLRDLPIGESHHLATTFPPEIWHRVVVVAWPRLPEAQLLAADATPELVGLALEHTLQLRLNPLANSEKRTPDGNWRAVVWEARRSRGARYASQLGGLVEAVHQVWDEAASQALTANTASAVHRVVFPETLVLAPPAVADPSPPHLSHLTHR